MTGGTVWRRARDFGAWFVTGFVTGSVAWVVIPALILGLHPTVVASGSMAPAIRVGDVVLIDRDPGERVPGEVIQFRDTGGELTLHRVVGVDGGGGYRTRGDANGVHDHPPVPEDRVVGRAVMLVPWVAHPVVLAAAAVAFLTIVLVELARRHRRRPGRIRAGCMAVAVAVGVGVTATPVSTAQFLDTTGSGQNRMAAVTVAPPTAFTATCPLVNLGPVDLDWTASTTPGITGYDILYRQGSNPFTVIDTVGAGQTSYDHSGVTGIVAVHTYMIRARMGPWISEPSNTDSVTVLVLLVCVNN